MSVTYVEEVRSGGGIPLPGMGLVVFDGQGGLHFKLNDGKEFGVDLSAVGLVAGVHAHIWSDAVSRTALVLHHTGPNVATIGLDSGTVGLTPIGHDRTLDTGFWRSDFVETLLGPLLVYELGVIAFDKDGSVRWHAEHSTIHWVFCGVEGDHVVFEEERQGRLSYCLKDGRKEPPR